MTADFVAFHAAERPDAVAIVDNGREITYAEFSRDIRKFTRALREFGLPPGAMVTIDCDDKYFNWLLRLACEELGLVTAMVKLPEGSGSSTDLRNFNLFLSDKTIAAESDRRHHPITPQWLQGILARADAGEVPARAKGPDDPLRIKYTSGTTGTPKKVLYARRIHDGLVNRTMWLGGFTRRSRYLLVIPLTVPAPTACIRAGGTVVFESRMPKAQAIAAHAITHTSFAAIHLKQILDELPEDYVKPAGLTILSSGAVISTTLRERALARIATDVCDIYGSNEAGYVSSIRGRAEFGTVWPDVQIELVNEHDGPVPPGEIGRIRVKSDCTVEGYLDDPGATRRMFKNGWFYPGDVGILHGGRQLQVLGRGDDLMIIGWRKLAPDMLEGLVLGVGGIDDVGVCSVPNVDGVEEVAVAVSGLRDNPQEFVARTAVAFREFEIGRIHLLKLDRIPRNANGKIQRALLKGDVIRAMRAGRG